jgi:hypothetical protein
MTIEALKKENTRLRGCVEKSEYQNKGFSSMLQKHLSHISSKFLDLMRIPNRKQINSKSKLNMSRNLKHNFLKVLCIIIFTKKTKNSKKE